MTGASESPSQGKHHADSRVGHILAAVVGRVSHMDASLSGEGISMLSNPTPAPPMTRHFTRRAIVARVSVTS